MKFNEWIPKIDGLEMFGTCTLKYGVLLIHSDYKKRVFAISSRKKACLRIVIFIQGGPLPVVNGVIITSINGLINGFFLGL